MEIVDRVERAKQIARAKGLRVVANETIAAARNLCHRASSLSHSAGNLCQTAVLRRALDSLRLPGITRPR